MTSFFAYQLPASFQPYMDTFFNDKDSLPEGGWGILWQIDTYVGGIHALQEDLCLPEYQTGEWRLAFEQSIEENKSRIAELIMEYLEKYAGTNGHRPQQYTFPTQMQPLIM